ncbi:hypothetical protein [Bacteroides sp. 224]|uniref:hypothetical protein n=1 Tax=Bacteroides sp. 224 TaxID=2302936 RepID=UPI0013D35519|nr:hypothetical protein [Bacteroides sp. 224]NDV64691.1 hypothetical protein [Bacteroides sp. 224]
MAQENMEKWMQYAKDLAKAERELKIEHWVYISFEVRNPDRSREVLHTIDIPRDMLDRWRWVINWRKAKLICKYPRKNIDVLFCYYDKRTGLHTGFDFILGKVASAKAQITKVERTIARYIDYNTHNNLFFNIETDEQLQKAYSKLEQKKENYQKMYRMLQDEIKKHRENSDKYKLFIGFKKLGEFDSISKAKQYADNSGYTGAFNLIGDKYYDSWYVSKKEPINVQQ